MKKFKLLILAVFTSMLMQSCMPTQKVQISPEAQYRINKLFDDAADRRAYDKLVRDLKRDRK